MLFLENLIRALLIFNGLRSCYCQRAFLGYHYLTESVGDRAADSVAPRHVCGHIRTSDGGTSRACEAHHAWCRPGATALLPGPLRPPAEAWTRGPGAYHHDRLETCGGTPGGAAWTVRTQPAWTVPWRPAIAACAAWRSAIATEPRPCERPVCRSIAM